MNSKEPVNLLPKPVPRLGLLGRSPKNLRVVFASALCLLTACSGVTAQNTGGAFPNPGITFFDVQERLSFYQRNTCNPLTWERLETYEPGPYSGEEGFSYHRTQARAFSQAVNGWAMLFLDHGDATYAEEAIGSLRRFADADAFQLRGHINGAAYGVGQVTQVLLPAWQILREYEGLSDADHELIEAWLIRLVNRTMREQPARNNHQTSQGATLVLAGVLFDRRDWFDRGIRIGYHDQIRQIRADGSWPLEAERGQRALVYTSRNIAHLVVIAEIALAQGIDLYSYSHQGRTLDDAIRFLIAARADNSLIDGYARANRFVPDDLQTFQPNAQQDPFDGHDSSWVPIYASRFPGTGITRELRRLRPPTNNVGIRFSPTGGNVTCLVGR